MPCLTLERFYLINIADKIEALISRVLHAHLMGERRASESKIVPDLTNALNALGFVAAKYRILGPLSLGRAPETRDLRPAQKYAEADIGIHRDGMLVGVIESEHDLAWVVPHGGRTPGSSGAPRYTMSSLAFCSKGEPFSSYAPLERMTYIAHWHDNASKPAAVLQAIRSDEPLAHNPKQLALFLISEKIDGKANIIRTRMTSLGVRYFNAGSHTIKSPLTIF